MLDISPLEPISRLVHCEALTALYNSRAENQARISFGHEHWPTATEPFRSAMSRAELKIAALNDAIDYHQKCYAMCESCDDREAAR